MHSRRRGNTKLNLDHKAAKTIISETLRKEGYNISFDKKIHKDFSIDLFAVRGSDAVAIELKPETRIDIFDVMTFESYTAALKADPETKSMKIRKLLLHKSVSQQAEDLSKNYGIELIAARNRDELIDYILKASKK